MPSSTPDPRRVAVLISGRGSNLEALADHAGPYRIVLVVSNKPEAPGLDLARMRGLPTLALSSRGLDREQFDRRVGDAIEAAGAGTIVLAGYMRLLSPAFVRRFAGRILNIHPSLLPLYKGLDTHARAIAAGDTEAGCSVHLVTEELDSGAVIAQARVPIHEGDTPEDLSARVLAEEHRLYPQAVSDFIRNGSGC
ncbi:phosphoribosylglycinamide formyltransferase [Sphingomonas ginkgonis]|uniref:Phosphoribosylglycinamide formyltransferase n=1 Tax=Sphingomonas ginkgonis TaxID=2315330 RepID=A0A3R9YMZ8_9SPHN|nr:phosphoribosylglycinamide formyltransferase [Sphingomonas ginkgonis]RST31206.1 phosphoribosylglycinamide formyltransferase [Sphingomonas ginkgonis]